MARPRKHRSRLAVSAVSAGAPLTDAQRAAVTRVLGRYGEADSQTLDAIAQAFEQFRSAHAALHQPASAADEQHDLETIAQLCRDVLDRLGRGEETSASVEAAARLHKALGLFPPRSASQLTAEPARAVEFEQARMRLLGESPDPGKTPALPGVHRVRWWAGLRGSHVRDLRLVLETCKDIGKPTFPKWSRVHARERLAADLRALYRDEWHQQQMSEWREANADYWDDSAPWSPPPRPAPESFVSDLLDALGVAFESRKRG